MRLKVTFRQGVWLAAGIILIAVAGRAFIIAARTDGGGDILKTHLLAGVPPKFRTEGPPADLRNYQQESWLSRECHRIQNDPKSTAEDYMGAAVVVVHNRWMFPRYVTDVLALGNIVWATSPRRDFVQHAARELDAEFILANRLTKRAIDLDPDEPDWWRLRAIICAQGEPVHWFKHRDEILKAAARIDADNAMYHYFNAHACWMASRNIQQQDRDGSQKSRIDELVSEAENSLKAAEEKQSLSFGLKRLTAIHSFMLKTSGPLEVRLFPGIQDTSLLLRYQAVMHAIRPIVNLMVQPKQANDLDRQLRLFGTLGKVYEQWSATKEVSVTAPFWLPLERDAFATYVQSVLNYPPDMQSDEVAKLHQQVEQLKADSIPLDTITQQLIAELEPEEREPQHAVNRSVIAVVGASFTILWVIISVVCFILWRLLTWRGNSTFARPNLLLASLVPATAIGLTFFFLGIAPVVGFNTRWVGYVVVGLRMAVYLAPVGVVLWWSIRFVRRKVSSPRSERGRLYQLVRLLLATAVSLVFILALFIVIDPGNRTLLPSLGDWLTEFKPAEEKGIGEYHRFVLPERLNIEQKHPAWMLVQWGVHDGIYWTAAVSLLLVLLWHAVSAWRVRKSDSATTMRWQDGARWHGIHFFHRAALAATWGALLSAIAFFWSVGTWIDSVNSRYETQMERLANPMWYDELILARLKSTNALP